MPTDKNNYNYYIFTIAGPFLIITGFLKQYFYYKFFNITISDFLSFNEIITSFLDDLVLFIFIPIFFLPFIIKSFSLQKEIDHEFIKAQKFNFLPPVYSLRSISIIMKYVILINFVILAFTLPVPGFLTFIFIFIPIILAIFIEVYYLNSVILNVHFLNKPYLTLISYFLSIYFLIIVFSTTCEIISRYYFGEKYDITITANNSQVITSETNFYIGKTEKYVFIFDKLNKETAVYKMENILFIQYGAISFPPNRPKF
jgi:hypothetical protein